MTSLVFIKTFKKLLLSSHFLMLDNELKYMIHHYLRSFVQNFMYLVHLNNPAGSHWGSHPALDGFKVQTEFDI